MESPSRSYSKEPRSSGSRALALTSRNTEHTAAHACAVRVCRVSSSAPRQQEPDDVPDPLWSWHLQLSFSGCWCDVGGDWKIRCWRVAALRCLAPTSSRSCCCCGGDRRADLRVPIFLLDCLSAGPDAELISATVVSDACVGGSGVGPARIITSGVSTQMFKRATSGVAPVVVREEPG